MVCSKSLTNKPKQRSLYIYISINKLRVFFSYPVSLSSFFFSLVSSFNTKADVFLEILYRFKNLEID